MVHVSSGLNCNNLPIDFASAGVGMPIQALALIQGSLDYDVLAQLPGEKVIMG